MSHSHCSEPAQPALTAEQRLVQMVELCRSSGLRKTRALEVLLEEMIERDSPQRLDDLASKGGLVEQCDRATVYRLLKRLEEKGIIRRLGFHERAAYYVIKYPDKHGDYLICKECGTIEILKRNCPVEKLEKEIAAETGFADLHHELEFFGTCPDCNDY